MPFQLIRHQHLFASSILFLSCINAASAQENQSTAPTLSPAENKDKAQQIEVKAKSEADNARRDTAAKTVITNEELMRYGDTNINDAMKRVPGVLVVKDQMQLPGMNGRYTQILIDGEPPRGITIADLPMNLIERVEIYRAGSAQFSSQAMAGTINIILKRVPSNKQAQIKLNLTNTYKPSGNVEWLSSDKIDNLSYSISLSARDNGALLSAPFVSHSEIFDEVDTKKQAYEFRSQRNMQAQGIRVNPRIQYKTEGGSSFTSSSSFNFNRNHFAGDERYDFLVGDTLPIWRTLRNSRADTQFGNTSLRMLSSVGDAKLDINTSANIYHFSDTTRDNTYSPNKLAFYQRDVNTNTKNLGFSNTGKITAPGNEEHDIVTGWSYSNANNHNRRQEIQFNYVPQTSESGLQTTLANIDKFAVFVQDEWKFRKHSSAYFGLRWEAVKIQSEGSTQEKLRHQSSVFSPIVQSLWQLNPENNDRLRLGLSRTYQAPADFYLISPIYKSANNSFLSPNFRGNPALRPELAWSLDAAYEHNGKDDWNYNLRAKLRSITGLHRDNVSQENGVWWMMYVNAGNALAKSLEFDTQFPLKRFIENAPNIDVSLDLSKHWSTVTYRIDAHDLSTAYTAKHSTDSILDPIISSIKLGFDYRANDLPLNLGSNFRYSEGHWQLSSKTQRELSSNPLDIDLYATWKFNKQSLLRFSIDNLMKHGFNYLSERITPDERSLTSYRNPAFRKVSLGFEHRF
ncbi:TonB-dependent receptor plug domain-containing protein [Undibacterium flavidum]|uniref:TonB-dependent receptor n=1 Tax=Undibacterium flavidum TaxID=2762297 RepID=A0ABR6Y9M5_9BURK|nr:TonB-dependent receptor [Undibacterium flavidum]MBC3873278.1 TonB-dependent receptor [Undibacterium flavidum]